MTREIKPTNCHFCGYLCAFNATVEDGRIVDLEPDPTRYPYDAKILAGCRRWRCNIETLDASDRVNFPLHRVGERGSGKFERVSWDAALDDIAARLRTLAEHHGPETLASMIGGPHTSFWPLHRFMNLFGSPNNMGIGQICWNPRIWMDVLTFGWTIEADIRPGVTDCLILWGTNPAQSDNSAFWQHIRQIGLQNSAMRESAAPVVPDAAGEDCTSYSDSPRFVEQSAGLFQSLRNSYEAHSSPALSEATDGQDSCASSAAPYFSRIEEFSEGYIPLVVVDPRLTQAATLADVWVPIKPGTDVAFALGLIHVLIAEDLIDHAFVDEWCHGIDELAVAAAEYAPARVAEMCDIDEELIVLVAHLWGNARAGALVSGRGIDQVGRNVAPAHRAICCLRALRGFVDSPGTMILQEGSDFVTEYDLEMTAHLAPEHKARCLNTAYTPLQCYEGFERIAQLTGVQGANYKLPERYLASAHPDLVLRAMETGEPYPVRALIVEATNPLLTYADTHRVFKALMRLDLIVVIDYYLTSTAQVADYVLPSAAAMERATFQAHGGVANNAYGGPAAVTPYYERKVDYDIFRLLGERLGQREGEDFWPQETFEDAIAYTLAPTGMSFEDYCLLGIYFQQPQPWKYCELSSDGVPRGFATTTGKVELASEALAALGGPRVPALQPQITLCSPELIARAEREGGAHLQLITGARKQPYNASMYFNIARFREKTPYPVAEMSPATAEQLGLSAGETVVLATDKGSARFILSLATMRDGLISADYGWWRPECALGAPDFGGMWESNINCLTSCSVEEGEDMIGTWSYNAIDCVITKG